LRPPAARYWKPFLPSFNLPALHHVLIITLLTIMRPHAWLEKFNILARLKQQPTNAPCRMYGMWTGNTSSLYSCPISKTKVVNNVPTTNHPHAPTYLVATSALSSYLRYSPT
jgi:hypothetical protein